MTRRLIKNVTVSVPSETGIGSERKFLLAGELIPVALEPLITNEALFVEESTDSTQGGDIDSSVVPSELPSRSALSKMNKSQLQGIAEGRGLSTDGTNDELVQRIIESDEEPSDPDVDSIGGAELTTYAEKLGIEVQPEWTDEEVRDSIAAAKEE